MRNRLIVNTIVTYSGFAFQLLLNIIQLKILTNFMPKTQLGTYFYAIGISLTAMAIAMTGFQPIFTRFIPLYEARDERDKIGRLIGLSVATYWLLGGISVILLEKFVPQIGLYRAARAVFIFGFLQLLNFALQGERKMVFFSLFPSVFSLGFSGSLWFLRAYLTPDLTFLLLGFWAAIVIPFQLLAMDVSPSFRGLRSIFKEIVPFWRYAFANAILYPLILYADRVIIWKFGTPASVAEFTVAKKFSDAIRRTLHVLSHVAAPEISYDQAKNRRLHTARLYKMGFIGLGALLTVIVVIWGKPLLALFSSSNYVGAYRYLVLLTLGVLFGGYWETTAITAYSQGKMNISLLIWISWTALYFSIAIVLTMLRGTIGTAIGYMVSSLLVSAFLMFAHLNNG